jgi:hypothetical protein
VTTKAGSKSEIDVLLRAARANGYKTVPAQGGHKKLVDHRGRPVVDGNGPLIISSSPSDARWRVMTVKRWMAAGVLKTDPFDDSPKGKAVQEKRGGSGKANRLTDPDVQQAKIDAIHAKAAAEREATNKLREQWEPIMVKIGGWEKRGSIAQLGDLIFWFGKWRSLVERFPSESAARQAVAQLKRGNTLSERNRKAISYFSDELLKATDVRERYFELVRLSKGLPAKEEDDVIRGGTPLPDPPAKEEDEKKKATTNGNHWVGTRPTLALEAVAQMMVGRTEVDEHVLRLGEQIQELEMRERGLLT